LITRDKQRENRIKIKTQFEDAWKEISDQTPPPTFIVVHGIVYETEQNDEFHDRYIITKNAGLSIGTSLNGLGNKEFFISTLPLEDVKFVSEIYIDPKLKIQDYFSKVIYFELES
jgi:hypothetical protein